MTKPLSKILLQWGLSLLLLLLLLVLSDVRQLTRLPEIHWDYILLVFLCNLGFTFAHNFRWKVIVEDLSTQKRSDFFFLYRSLVDSYALGKIIPMDVSLLGLRSYYLKRFRNMPISIAVFSVLLDRFLDIVLFLVMALPSFFVITRTTSATWSVVTLVLLLIGQGLITFWKKGDTFHFLLSFYRTFMVQWISKIPFLGTRMEKGMEGGWENSHFSLRSVLCAMGWNYVKYIFLCLRFYFTGLALGIQFPMLKSFFFVPFVQLSGFINITPGGLGVVEMGTYGALFLMGVPQSQILIFVFGQRILLILLFMSLFVLNRFFNFIQSRWKRVEGPGWND
jgi:uncharacterized protein (TIRG00374 family)